jgi:hypothetical protein
MAGALANTVQREVGRKIPPLGNRFALFDRNVEGRHWLISTN